MHKPLGAIPFDGLLRIATDDELRSVLANVVGHLYYKDSVTLVAIVYSSFATWLISFTDKIARWLSPVANINKTLLIIMLIIKLLLLPFILLRGLGIRRKRSGNHIFLI